MVVGYDTVGTSSELGLPKTAGGPFVHLSTTGFRNVRRKFYKQRTYVKNNHIFVHLHSLGTFPGSVGPSVIEDPFADTFLDSMRAHFGVLRSLIWVFFPGCFSGSARSWKCEDL